jgi:serine/threonine-protein kinase
MAGVLAGRYELEVPLGRGGSGEVWRGRDMATRQPVAVKLIELAEIDDPGLLAETIGRFRREAVVVARLRHPNIVAALDAGRIENELFLVMELVHGVSLATMQDQRAARGMGLFPVAGVLHIAEQACAGLAAAHAAAVVHRDIKPGNLMVTARLHIKIIDFGIAQLLADNAPRLTMPAHTVGTLAYISPEQARGGNVDGRADLYSLGCVLYELLSGRQPFRADLPEQLLMMHVLDQAVPLSTVRPDLPAGLSELVSGLMEKDPDARPADATQVIRHIAAISAPPDGSAPVNEADRQTVRADDPPPAADGPSRDVGTPGAGRSTVLTTERLADHGGSETPTGPIWIGPGAAPPPGATLQDPPPPGATLRDPPPPGATLRDPPPPGATLKDPPPPEATLQDPPPPRAAPQAAPPPGAPPQAVPAARGEDSGAPAWPTVPRSRHRRRRRWGRTVSTLLTLAIVAGVGIYVWLQKHEKLQVTSAAVAVASQPAACNVTFNIIGTIHTNGRGGPINYQWVQDSGKNAPVLVADDAQGRDTVQVELKWSFRGKGTHRAVAELRVLEPQQATASSTFTYSCR